MEEVTYFFIFWLGAVLGSFLNVCSYRLPRDLSIVRPRSFCPHCKKQIKWYENIPLISFLFLLGKCSSCKGKIASRYFLTELTSALLWLFLWQEYGFSLFFFGAIFFLSTLLVVFMSDFETGLIPDKITLPGMVVGILFSLVNQNSFPQGLWYDRLLASVLGLLVGGGILWVTGILGNLIFRKESMGGGDIKLLAMMGAFLGVQKAVFVFLLAPFIALPFALWQRFRRHEETIPYGPFLALMGALLFIKGDFILTLISKLYGV